MTAWRQSVAALAVLVAATIGVPRAIQAQTPGGAADTRPVILAEGESTTAGYGVPRDLSYPGQLQKELDTLGYRYRVVNQGVSGSTTEGALTRLSRGMSLLPKIVIIALGGNDSGAGFPADRTRANMDKLISLYKRAGAVVIVANRNLPAEKGRDDESLFAQLARQHGAVLMAPLLTGVDGHPELTIEDGHHPNPDGYAIVIRTVLDALQPYLKEKASELKP